MSGSSHEFALVSFFRKGGVFLCVALLVLGLICPPFSSLTRSAEARTSNGTLVIAIDPGHGGNEPGAYANGIREEQANWDIAQACVAELETYEGVKVVLTKDYQSKMSREQRIQVAVDQGADAVVSIHCNSAGSATSANGCEAWVPNNSAYRNDIHVMGRDLGNHILNKLSALGLNNRGAKVRSVAGDSYPSPGGDIDYYGINYYARLKDIPGIIVEHAFLTNPSDAAKLADPAWRTKMGEADAQGIAAYFGLKKKGQVVTDPNLSKRGEAVTSPMSHESDPAIMGDSRASVGQMVAMFKNNKAIFPSSIYGKYGAASIEEFCTILSEEADAEDVRAEVMFAQSMVETGWFRFGGQVDAEQCNFSGLGATDGGAKGADFSSYGKNGVRMGLRAQAQHLKAYASKEPLNNACVDPRFNLVARGSAATVKALTGKWATASNYGETLTKKINELLGGGGGASTVKISLADVPSSLLKGGSATIYVDGVATDMNVNGAYGTFEFSGTGSHSVVMYEYNATDSSNAYSVYPTKMYTWILTSGSGSYTTQRYYGFDDLLRYAGSSIRITGKNGIRMLTGMLSGTKGSLANSGVHGYTLVETGTLLAWSDRVEDGSLTFDTSGVSRGKAFVRGKQNPVLSTSNGVEHHTNVLVGFSSAEQYERSMAMRPYAILADASGNQITVYGGTVHRSILYIAEQNADSFKPGTEAYEFVHGIIDACKG